MKCRFATLVIVSPAMVSSTSARVNFAVQGTLVIADRETEDSIVETWGLGWLISSVPPLAH